MKHFEEKLEAASAAWVDQGVISPEQRAEILRLHPVPAGTSRFVAIVATIGGLLFATGISLLIKANWTAIGDWTKIGGLVALLAGAYAGGAWLIERGQRALGEAALMVGGILFLCGIALVSQIFHLNSRPAAGVFVWWLGIVAVPWLMKAKGAQFLSLAALLVWLGMEMNTAGSWIEVGARLRSGTHDWPFFAAVYVPLGLALWCSGLAMRGTRWEEFSGLQEKWGIVVTGAALYWLGFVRHEWKRSWHEMARLDVSTWCALAVALALLGAAAVGAARASGRETRLLAPWLGLALAVPVCLVGIGSIGDGGWLWSGLAWLVLFVVSVATIRIGLETGREGWVNLGILFVALNVVTRYFDLFGTLLEGGVFFIVTGLLVTGLGLYLERKRRSLVAGLRKEVAP